jgi:hypothetical protein
MDLNDYWQENKRFVLVVAGGALAFLLGELLIANAFGDDLQREKKAIAAAQATLRQPQYGTRDLEAARADADALAAAVEQLATAVEFRPRERFVVGRDGEASTRYVTVAGEVREELLRLAGRANLALPQGLGLPVLSPTREVEIARTLEALDVVDRVVRLAAETGVRRIHAIDIKLDPGLTSRQGVGAIERTRVAFDLRGKPAPIEQLVLATQSDRYGQPLTLASAELATSPEKADEGKYELAFYVVHLHREPEAE